MFGEKVFTNPKDEFLLKDLFKALNINGNDIVLDFFAGSATTMHASFELNKEIGSKCKTILVQAPESLHNILKTAKGGAKKVTKNAIEYCLNKGFNATVSEISKERIRLVGESAYKNSSNDCGFRVLKVDTSNMSDIYYSPDQISQGNLELLVNNIKEDRTDEDLLFQVLLDWGVDLTLPIRKETICNKTVFFVDDNALVACFDTNITEELIKELAGLDPLRVVFRDDGFVSDDVKINADQIFKQLAPGTEVKSI